MFMAAKQNSLLVAAFSARRFKKYFFLGLLLLKAFTRRVAEFGVKNYLGVYSQGVFSNKVRIEHSSKAFKRVYLCFCSF